MSERPLRVVQVSTCDVGGGAERIASDLHRLASERGLHSTLAVGHRFSAASDAVLIPNDERRSAWARAMLRFAPPVTGFHVSPGRAGLLARRAVKAIAEPRRAWRRARGFEDFDYPGTAAIPELGGARADLVHLHNLHGGYFDLRELPAISASIPAVLTPHDTWLSAGHCAYTLDCDRWLSGCGDCPRTWVLPAIPRDRSAENWALKRDIYRRSRVHVAAPSRWALDHLERSIFAEAIASARVIPNGVDLRVFHPGDRAAARKNLGLPLDAVILTFSTASETNPYKDMATLTAALPAVARATAGRDILLVALGSHAVSAPSRDAHVLTVPYLADPADVAEYLQAADASIHTALAENLPLAIIEALASGTAVVASDVGGVPEIITGANGVLVPPRDAGALADAVAALVGDKTRLREMGKTAAADAAKRFDLERMADAYFDLYASLADERGAHA